MRIYLDKYFSIKNPSYLVDEKSSKIKIELKKIPLPALKSKLTKHAIIPTYKKNVSAEEKIIERYLTVRTNLQRIWLKEKDHSVINPLLFIKKLEEMNKQITIYQQIGIMPYELSQYLISFKEEMQNFLMQYEDLHKKPEDTEDDIMALLAQVGGEA